MKITLTAELGKMYARFIQRNLIAASVMAGTARLRELCVVFVNDRTMSRLHKTFMNASGTTDVLTFPLDSDKHGNVISGEIYLCVPEARRQSKIHATDVKTELLLYAVHGMLHLLGYDDTTPAAYREMHQTEDKIMTALGFGPVFFAARKRRKGANA